MKLILSIVLTGFLALQSNVLVAAFPSPAFFAKLKFSTISLKTRGQLLTSGTIDQGRPPANARAGANCARKGLQSTQDTVQSVLDHICDDFSSWALQWQIAKNPKLADRSFTITFRLNGSALNSGYVFAQSLTFTFYYLDGEKAQPFLSKDKCIRAYNAIIIHCSDENHVIQGGNYFFPHAAMYILRLNPTSFTPISPSSPPIPPSFTPILPSLTRIPPSSPPIPPSFSLTPSPTPIQNSDSLYRY